MLVVPGFVFGSIPRVNQGHIEPTDQSSFSSFGHAFKVVKNTLSRPFKHLFEKKAPVHTPEKGINTRTFQRVKPTHTDTFSNLLNKTDEKSAIYDESGYLQPLALRQKTTSAPKSHQAEEPIYATIDETAIRSNTKSTHLKEDIPPPLPPRNKAPILDNGRYLHPLISQNIYTEINDEGNSIDDSGYAKIDETAIRTNTKPDNLVKDIPPPLPPKNKAPILDTGSYLHPVTSQNIYTEINDENSSVDDSSYARIDDLAHSNKASPNNLAQEAPPLPPRNSIHIHSNIHSKKKHPALEKIKLISSAIGKGFKHLLKRQPQVDIITQGPDTKVFKRVSPTNINMPNINPGTLN